MNEVKEFHPIVETWLMKRGFKLVIHEYYVSNRGKLDFISWRGDYTALITECKPYMTLPNQVSHVYTQVAKYYYGLLDKEYMHYETRSITPSVAVAYTNDDAINKLLSWGINVIEFKPGCVPVYVKTNVQFVHPYIMPNEIRWGYHGDYSDRQAVIEYMDSIGFEWRENAA